MQQDIERLIMTCETIRLELLSHNNSNTPSSKGNFEKKTQAEVQRKQLEKEDPSKSEGGSKKGHKGTSRKRRADRTEHHTLSKCNKCGSSKIRKTKTTHKFVTDFKVEVETVNHIIEKYHCDSCNGTVQDDDSLIPGTEFGPNTITSVNTLSCIGTPLRKIAYLLESITEIKVSHRTVENMLEAAHQKIKPVANEILEDIRSADHVHSDETKDSVSGLNSHVWALATHNETYYHINGAKSRDVLDMLLGGRDKILVCDGNPVYAVYERQDCWAHKTRRGKFEARNGDPQLQALSDSLLYTYHRAKLMRAGDIPIDPGRIRAEILAVAARYEELGNKFGTFLESSADYSIRFLTRDGMEPTNNRAERAIRPFVLQRNVKGWAQQPKGHGDDCGPYDVLHDDAAEGPEPTPRAAQAPWA